MPIIPLWAKLGGVAAVCGFLVLYGYSWGAKSVENEWNDSLNRQKAIAAVQSASYQEYRKRTDPTNLRKELAHEISSGTGCPVIDDKRLRLYEQAGRPNDSR